jgi:hypothetical protein
MIDGGLSIVMSALWRAGCVRRWLPAPRRMLFGGVIDQDVESAKRAHRLLHGLLSSCQFDFCL